jgi:hypothetical protein
MNLNRCSKKLMVVLAFASLLSCLLCACSSSSPSEADARQVLEARSGGLYKITSFRKTNGQSSETSGVKGYRLEYEAEAQCLRVNWNSPYPPLRDDFAGGPQCTKVGEVHKMKGTIGFKQTENGWRAVSF